ncbi:MAG TPA: DUF2459 domain-containing protein [Burkholderiales bacterium]
MNEPERTAPIVPAEAGERFRRLGLALALLVLLAGCANGPGAYAPPGTPAASIYVVTQGWHTGIVLRRADARPELWPEVADFPRVRWLLVDWGERDYFPAARFSLWYGLKALFWPTASVVHVTGFDAPPPQQFAGTELVRVGLTREGLEALNRYIGAAYERGGAPRAPPLRPSPYGAGWFYLGRETFHLFRTCNVWVAQALRAAGLPVSARFVLLPEGVMRQLRPIGETIGPQASVSGQPRSAPAANRSHAAMNAVPPSGVTGLSPRYPVRACT